MAFALLLFEEKLCVSCLLKIYLLANNYYIHSYIVLHVWYFVECEIILCNDRRSKLCFIYIYSIPLLVYFLSLVNDTRSVTMS